MKTIFKMPPEMIRWAVMRLLETNVIDVEFLLNYHRNHENTQEHPSDFHFSLLVVF